MSLLRYFFDDDWTQRRDIEELRARARLRSRRARRGRIATNRRIEELEDQVAVLELITQTMLTVLEESGGIDPEVFSATLQHIDADDGVVDGRITPAAEDGDEEPPAAPVPKRRRRE